MSRNVSETENVTVFVGTPKTEVQATLVIDGFPEELAMKPHKAFMSDDFLAKKSTMRLMAYPNGYNEEFKGFVLLEYKFDTGRWGWRMEGSGRGSAWPR